jgi:hypothetical protein
MKKLIVKIFTFISILFLAGCEPTPPSPDQVQRKQQESLSAQGNSMVGMPLIVNFQEKRMLKDIIEKRDQLIPTITYIQASNGKLIKLCDSVGFGISAATQYTNPQRVTSNGSGSYMAMPQSDPNGLFSPADTEGKWIMCKDPISGKASPVFIEPRIVVSPFALK